MSDKEKFEMLINDFYEYTITISIVEDELLDYYREYLAKDKDKSYISLVKMVKEDMRYDFENNIGKIEKQLAIDVCEYDNSIEIPYIKMMYKEIKEFFPSFYVKEIEEIMD